VAVAVEDREEDDTVVEVVLSHHVLLALITMLSAVGDGGEGLGEVTTVVVFPASMPLDCTDGADSAQPSARLVLASSTTRSTTHHTWNTTTMY